MVDMVLRQHNIVYGPPPENQDANQYLIPPTNNTHGIALKIFLNFGNFSFPIKMSVEAMEAFAIENG